MTRYGHPNAISPTDLADMHPALVGAGERAAAGLPPANANTPISAHTASAASPVSNMLFSGAGQPASQPGSSANMLLGQVGQSAPPPAPPPPPPPAPSVPAALPGQAASTAIGNATGADKMTDADLANGFARLSYIHDGLANMTRQGSAPTHDDVLAAMAKGVKDGIFPAAEAGQIMGGLTSDPDKLPAELDQRHRVALHQMLHLAGEMQKRNAAANSGGKA